MRQRFAHRERLLAAVCLVIICVSVIGLQPTLWEPNDQATMLTAASDAACGDTIRIQPGTYDDWGPIIFLQGCTEGNKLIIEALNQGDVNLTGDVRFRLNGADWVIIRKLDFSNANNEVGEQNNVIAIGSTASPSSNNRITNCRFYSVGRNGVGNNGAISVGETDVVRIDNCLFDDLRQNGIRGEFRDDLGNDPPTNVTINYNTFTGMNVTHAGEAAIYCGAGPPFNYGNEPTYWVVEYNSIANHASPTGEAHEIVGFKTSSNIIRFNTFMDTGVYVQISHGVSLRIGEDNEVYGNTFINMPGGVKIYGTGHKIYNNVFRNVGLALRFNTGCLSDLASITGTHNDGGGAWCDGTDGTEDPILCDKTKSWDADDLILRTVFNETDGSSCVITDNDATSSTCDLSGGTNDYWTDGDAYETRFINTGSCFAEVAPSNVDVLNNTIDLETGQRATRVIGNASFTRIAQNNDIQNNILRGDFDELMPEDSSKLTLDAKNASCVGDKDPWFDCTGSGTGTITPNDIDTNLYDALNDEAVTGVTGVNAIEADALLDGNSRLTIGSPAVDAGLTNAIVTTDADGVPRPQGPAFDIGAYEFGGRGRTGSPLATGQTGSALSTGHN